MITSSASQHGVYQADIGYLISLPRSEVDVHRGEPSDNDVRFSGGKVVARPTIARGCLADGMMLEVGLRRDFRRSKEVCVVFHSRYL